MKRRICPSCNEGDIVDQRKAGRSMPYRTIPDLAVPEELAIPTCNRCGEEWLDAAASARVEEALRQAYQVALCRKVEDSLRRLAEAGTTQQELERLLGLSVGYISKLKGGKETSPQLVATLMLLASEPQARIAELRSLWSHSASFRGDAKGRGDAVMRGPNARRRSGAA